MKKCSKCGHKIMPKITKFSVGSKWRVDRDHNPFTFTIVGKSDIPGARLVRCKVEWDRPSSLKDFEEYYSQEHLKKHAKWVKPE